MIAESFPRIFFGCVIIPSYPLVCSHSELITLLHRRGADLSISDKHQACPVHYAAQMSGTASTNMGSSVSISRADAAAKALETLDTLLGYNVPLDVEDQDQRQPLLWAASSGARIIAHPHTHCNHFSDISYFGVCCKELYFTFV